MYLPVLQPATILQWQSWLLRVPRFLTVCNSVWTGMTGEPARKMIPVLISWWPDLGLWRAETRICHSQDPGQTNRVTSNVPSRNPISETWWLHQERKGSGRVNDASQKKGKYCIFSRNGPVNALAPGVKLDWVHTKTVVCINPILTPVANGR